MASRVLTDPNCTLIVLFGEFHLVSYSLFISKIRL